eukprot:scaffold75888_cov29-Tisochrysis_lutea.AAC.2
MVAGLTVLALCCFCCSSSLSIRPMPPATPRPTPPAALVSPVPPRPVPPGPIVPRLTLLRPTPPAEPLSPLPRATLPVEPPKPVPAREPKGLIGPLGWPGMHPPVMPPPRPPRRIIMSCCCDSPAAALGSWTGAAARRQADLEGEPVAPPQVRRTGTRWAPVPFRGEGGAELARPSGPACGGKQVLALYGGAAVAPRALCSRPPAWSAKTSRRVRRVYTTRSPARFGVSLALGPQPMQSAPPGTQSAAPHPHGQRAVRGQPSRPRLWPTGRSRWQAAAALRAVRARVRPGAGRPTRMLFLSCLPQCTRASPQVRPPTSTRRA